MYLYNYLNLCVIDNFLQLEDAVKKQDLPQTESLYHDTTIILQEVMTKMA